MATGIQLREGSGHAPIVKTLLWRDEAEPMAAHRVTFEKNVVRDNERFGVLISGQTTGAVLRDNTIEAGDGDRQRVGVQIGPKAGEVKLESNTIRAETELVDERPTKDAR